MRENQTCVKGYAPAVNFRFATMPAKKKLALEHWISYRFGVVASRVGAVMASRYVARHDLPMPAWRSLAVIARYGPLSAGELGAKTSSDAFRVVRAIDLLVKRGLITRDPDPADRRRARLELTNAGRALYLEIEEGAIANEMFLRSGLTAAEIRTLESILARIDAQVNALAHTGADHPESK
jgi:DNA-binding MarR family transcriptional regulator